MRQRGDACYLLDHNCKQNSNQAVDRHLQAAYPRPPNVYPSEPEQPALTAWRRLRVRAERREPVQLLHRGLKLVLACLELEVRAHRRVLARERVDRAPVEVVQEPAVDLARELRRRQRPALAHTPAARTW
jgi:hypothetical protein